MALGDSFPGNRFSIELGNFQVETVQSVSAVSIKQDVIEGKFVTKTGELVTRKQNGGPASGQITIVRGMDKSNAFTKWLKTTLVDANLDAARQNITIVQYDNHKEVVHRYHLSNAWASGWETNPFDATASAVATETVTLEYEELTIE